MGIGTKCQWKGKAEGGRIGFAEAGIVDDDCMRNAINEHKRKLADGNEAAIKKQMIFRIIPPFRIITPVAI